MIENPNGSGIYESHEFWNHLAKEKLIPGRYKGHFYPSGDIFPKSPYEAGSYEVNWFTPLYGFPDSNNLRLGRTLPANPWWTGLLRPDEAADIDAKLDDGIPSTGFITARAGYDMLWSECTTTDPAAGASIGQYAFTNTGKTCILDIRLD